MVKKNFKKKMIISAMVLAGTTSVVSLMSCGGVKKYDQTLDNKLVIASTFSASSPSHEALELIIKKWNAHVKEEREKENGDKTLMEIEIRSIAGGYEALGKDLNTKIQAKSKTNLYNIMFNYPTVVANLNKYDMKLNLAGSTDDEKAVGLYDVIQNMYNEQLLSSNNAINDLDKSNDEKKMWLFPAAPSTEILSINGSVFAYILETSVKDGEATIKKEDAEFFKNIKEKGENDSRRIKEIWGKYVSSEKGLKGHEFKKSDFESYEGLFELSNKIKNSYPQASEGKFEEKAENVLGLDAMANTVYAMMASYANKDLYDLFYNKETKKFYTGLKEDAKNLTNEIDKEANKNFEKVFNQVISMLKEGTLFIKTGSDYSSNKFKNHRILFQISSSTGYKHNHVAKGTKQYKYTVHENNEDIESSSGAELKTIMKIEKPTQAGVDAGIIFVLRGDKYNNYVYSEKLTKEKGIGILGSSYSYLIGQEYEKQLKELLKYDSKKEGEQFDFSLSTDSELNSFVKKYLNGFENKEDSKKSIAKRDWAQNKILLIDKNDKLALISNEFINPTKDKEKELRIVEETISDEKTLQESELITLRVPLYAAKGDVNKEEIKKTFTLQGPSVFAMHSNKEENLATLKFLKWFLTEEIDWEAEKDKYSEDSKKETKKDKKDKKEDGKDYPNDYRYFVEKEDFSMRFSSKSDANTQKFYFNNASKTLKKDVEYTIVFTKIDDNSKTRTASAKNKEVSGQGYGFEFEFKDDNKLEDGKYKITSFKEKGNDTELLNTLDPKAKEEIIANFSEAKKEDFGTEIRLSSRSTKDEQTLYVQNVKDLEINKEYVITVKNKADSTKTKSATAKYEVSKDEKKKGNKADFKFKDKDKLEDGKYEIISLKLKDSEENLLDSKIYLSSKFTNFKFSEKNFEPKEPTKDKTYLYANGFKEYENETEEFELTLEKDNVTKTSKSKFKESGKNKFKSLGFEFKGENALTNGEWKVKTFKKGTEDITSTLSETAKTFDISIKIEEEKSYDPSVSFNRTKTDKDKQTIYVNNIVGLIKDKEYTFTLTDKADKTKTKTASGKNSFVNNKIGYGITLEFKDANKLEDARYEITSITEKGKKENLLGKSVKLSDDLKNIKFSAKGFNPNNATKNSVDIYANGFKEYEDATEEFELTLEKDNETKTAKAKYNKKTLKFVFEGKNALTNGEWRVKTFKKGTEDVTNTLTKDIEKSIDIKIKEKEVVKKTALNYFIEKSGYIALQKNKELKGTTPFANEGAKLFQDALDKSNEYRWNSDPTEVRADTFRKSIDSSYANLRNRMDTAIQEKNTSDIEKESKFSEFIKKLKIALGASFKK
ncbi:P68 family surface lipoprotein [Mesomycoplasma neurolyticum]|uniref:Uncharacterized lipoprotein MPN_097 n=1 Tax=Mesomycoplasma neurolyticum TaxID=2120 RepID=A0A449A5V2_9BACT|nr:P80 family lipoprotein [Mesomycoplasma neurolyticum]VEU59618.1 Uncharacterized lipoprotein MPN_097 precursor [Mesomycoplasma neurolyticum]